MGIKISSIKTKKCQKPFKIKAFSTNIQWRQQDSNLRPSTRQADALPAELCLHTDIIRTAGINCKHFPPGHRFHFPPGHRFHFPPGHRFHLPCRSCLPTGTGSVSPQARLLFPHRHRPRRHRISDSILSIRPAPAPSLWASRFGAAASPCLPHCPGSGTPPPGPYSTRPDKYKRQGIPAPSAPW